MWYNYLYSDSNRSVIFTPNAIAIISSWNNVGDTLPFSMLFIVDFPIPDFFDNSINVNPFEVLISQTRIFILLTSFLKESVQNEIPALIWCRYRIFAIKKEQPPRQWKPLFDNIYLRISTAIKCHPQVSFYHKTVLVHRFYFYTFFWMELIKCDVKQPLLLRKSCSVWQFISVFRPTNRSRTEILCVTN